MVIEYIRYELPADSVDEFLQAYARAAAQLDATEGCLSYDLSRGVELPGNVIARIEWESIDSHQRDFTGGPHFDAFIAQIRPWLGHVVEMSHYTPTGVFSHRREGR